MRVVITGGTGFVGPHLVAELESHGHAVVVPVYPEFDVTNPATIAEALSPAPDAVIHLAAVAHPASAHSDPAGALQVTVGGTINLLEAIRATRSRPFVLVVSSSEVYGRPHSEDLPLSESAPLRPVSSYALTKAGQESVALAYFASRAMSGAVVRPFNHSGPGQTAQYVIPALAGRVADAKRKGRPEVSVGNMSVRRDFLHVRDVVRAYRLLIEIGAAGDGAVLGRVFNVATGRPVAIGDILSGLGVAAGIVPVGVADPALVRPDDIAEISGDPQALEAATGWRPETSLEDLLRDVLADVEQRLPAA